MLCASSFIFFSFSFVSVDQFCQYSLPLFLYFFLIFCVCASVLPMFHCLLIIVFSFLMCFWLGFANVLCIFIYIYYFLLCLWLRFTNVLCLTYLYFLCLCLSFANVLCLFIYIFFFYVPVARFCQCSMPLYLYFYFFSCVLMCLGFYNVL